MMVSRCIQAILPSWEISHIFKHGVEQLWLVDGNDVRDVFFLPVVRATLNGNFQASKDISWKGLLGRVLSSISNDLESLSLR